MNLLANTWNFTRPDLLSPIPHGPIRLRGYNKEAFLTGEFARKVVDREIRSLSVSNISDFICPERRDTYYYKGKNKPKIISKDTWGNKTGQTFEKHLALIMKTRILKQVIDFEFIRGKGRKKIKEFKFLNLDEYDKLVKLEEPGDTDWLFYLMDLNSRMEWIHLIINKHLIGNKISSVDFLTGDDCEILPNVGEIGISSSSTPDFILSEYGAIGDIKTGDTFKIYHQLTCAGYALAYENAHKVNIDWGMVYFFPKKHYSAYVKPISTAQIYIFKIDDALRQYFLNRRNAAYQIISQDSAPPFPKDKDKCLSCRFLEYCKSVGLEIDE